MKNKLIRDRLRWGTVVAMGLVFSLCTSGEKMAEKNAVPHEAGEKKEEFPQTVRLEEPCTSTFLIIHNQ